MNTKIPEVKFKKENLLIAFTDLSNFFSIFSTKSDQEMMNYLSWFYETTGDCIEEGGGRVVKFEGDSALIVIPEEHIDEGIRAMIKMKKTVDELNREKGYKSRLKMQAHFGSVLTANLGTRKVKSFDIAGNTVNIAARLKATGFTITPETFRKLKPETRKLFKKHTPPVSYIGVNERHKD